MYVADNLGHEIPGWIVLASLWRLRWLKRLAQWEIRHKIRSPQNVIDSIFRVISWYMGLFLYEDCIYSVGLNYGGIVLSISGTSCMLNIIGRDCIFSLLSWPKFARNLLNTSFWSLVLWHWRAWSAKLSYNLVLLFCSEKQFVRMNLMSFPCEWRRKEHFFLINLFNFVFGSSYAEMWGLGYWDAKGDLVGVDVNMKTYFILQEEIKFPFVLFILELT